LGPKLKRVQGRTFPEGNKTWNEKSNLELAHRRGQGGGDGDTYAPPARSEHGSNRKRQGGNLREAESGEACLPRQLASNGGKGRKLSKRIGDTEPNHHGGAKKRNGRDLASLEGLGRVITKKVDICEAG